MSRKSGKRPWRKMVKKLQRKRKRQKLARQRVQEMEEAELEKYKDPQYKLMLEKQDAIERQQKLDEENERLEQEQLWCRRELLAQKQFQRDQLRRQTEEAELEAERLKQEEKLKLVEDARQKKREEIKLQREKAQKDFDDIMTCMQEYLEDHTMKTPDRLDYSVESRPGEKSCDFFDKTNCCRFGPGCTFNHQRPLLAKIIFIKHFFQHPLLNQEEHEEYSRSDSELELSERDLRESYDEFCEDVWPVLEEFGKILNFRTVRNVHAHLSGHVFVEYMEKRSALKAFINLQNRYYASKRLNVEFSNIRQWHKAVCGMRSNFLKGLSLGRKCPKGVKCNFFHLMKNMDNKYNKPIDNPERSTRSVSKTSKTAAETPVISWNTDDILRNRNLVSRNWRWSESPEVELKAKTAGENFLSATDNESRNSSYSPRSKSSHRKSRSNSPNKRHKKDAKKSKSRSPSLKRDKSKNHTSKSLSSRPHKNKGESSSAKKQSDLKEAFGRVECTTEKMQKCNSYSLRKKSSHKRPSSPNCSHHKRAKKSRSKSPKKQKRN